MLDVVLEILRQTGLAGIAALAIWFAVRKDRKATELYDRLEAKSEKYVTKYFELSNELNQTINELTNALDLEETGG